VFTNPFSKWIFRWLHPDFGVKLAQYLSVKNKLISGDADVKFLGEENEWLVVNIPKKLETKHYNYLILVTVIANGTFCWRKSEYVNLGDWIGYFTYGVFLSVQHGIKDLSHYSLKFICFKYQQSIFINC
jgi:UDP-2,3-diacylglucosamine hydrolase